MALIVQPRDRRIMQFAFSFRVVTYEQIRRKFFSSNYETASRNRIRSLVNHGYLRPIYSEVGSRIIRSVSITEKAWPFVATKLGFEVDKPHFRSESTEHDFRLAEVGLRFEKLQLFDKFLPENLLQSSTYLATDPLYRDLVNLQSDGALALKHSDGSSMLYAVELEISKKAPERYIQKIQSYYRAGGIDGVIYVCGNQEIRDLVARADRTARTDKQSIVYLNTEDSVLNSQEKMIFKGVDGGGIGLF